MHKIKIIVILMLFIFLLVLPWSIWQIKSDSELEVVIIDKTVPDLNYREHKGLVWLLNQQKIKKPNTKEAYDYREDYYGFFPKENEQFETRDLNVIKEKIDLIYIADTYGVYTADLYNDNVSGERSELIYGGMTMDEIEIVRKAAYQGTTVIAEFNTFGSPTGIEERKAMYDLLNVTWSGWMGRYFDDLSSGNEVPNWVVNNYESREEVSWEFHGNGFVFVNENDHVVVLDEQDVLEKGIPFQLTKSGTEFFGKQSSISYQYWFDIVSEGPGSEVLATYDLRLEASGLEKLQENKIPTFFPAVIKNKNAHYTSYYFSGDYVDYSNIPKYYQFAGWTKLMEWLPLTKTESFFWKSYSPMMKKILEEVKGKAIAQKDTPPINKEVYEIENINMIARTKGNLLQVYSNGEWEDLFVKGVNMGMAIPGKWFTEFPKQESTYYDWFKLIGEMNANTIRVYTLMDPSFYRAFKRYNDLNHDKPLWLLQEIWPEENPEDNNYLKEEYVKTFYQEIEYAIDAIHGKASIAERRGRAYGDYYADVSQYTLGFLVGREVEPEEVVTTNEKNNVYSYDGQYVGVEEGSPTEVWLSKSCDYLLEYQENKYSWQHPVGIISWPTLDVMDHDAEWNEIDGTLEYNDRVSIDIRHFNMGDQMKGGFFGAYHIYPNYPDFMNNTIEYANYFDDQGVFRYGGYLKDFMAHHEGYPALVAEFGLATGMGNAHVNPDGYNHGAMTEKEQGEGIVRMMEGIKSEGYAGGVIFEWMDEWAKKTWTTESFMIPYEHNVFWHNALDPEQNYGILAMEAQKPKDSQQLILGNNLIREVNLSGNETYLYVDIKSLDAIDLNKYKLLIGIDTYDPNKGTVIYDPSISMKAPSGMEFLVEFYKDKGNIKVIPSYNISNYSYGSVADSQGPFEKINPLINSRRVTKDGRIIEEIRTDNSVLNKGLFTESFYHWNQDEELIQLRLPWGILNVTDPTTYGVLDDLGEYYNYPERDGLNTAITDGFRLTFLLVSSDGEIIDQLPNDFKKSIKPFLWQTWGEPRFIERPKESYWIIRDEFLND